MYLYNVLLYIQQLLLLEYGSVLWLTSWHISWELFLPILFTLLVYVRVTRNKRNCVNVNKHTEIIGTEE